MKSISILLAVLTVIASAKAVPHLTRTVRTSEGDVVFENVMAGASSGGGLRKLPKGSDLDVAPQIVGGGVVTSTSKFPQVVAIVATDKRGRVESYCSGVIIDKKVVLTAAHCARGFDTKQFSYSACSGTVNVKKDTKNSKCGEILSAWVPRKYNNKKAWQGYDIALLSLRAAITSAHGKRVKVSFSKPKNNLKAFSVGFGATKGGKASDGKMRSVAANIVLNEGQCKVLSTLGLKNESNKVCAKSKSGGTCNGDSGGPLLVPTKKKNEYICVGILSLGACAKGKESVYGSLYNNDHAKVFKAGVKAAKGKYLTGTLPK